jgi:hypothetical protein
MTDEEINERVAMEIMGEARICNHKKYTDETGAFCAQGCENFIVPYYSTDMSTAMQVIEKMREARWSFACTLYEGRLPYASFCKLTAASSRNAESESLPRAICLAALAVVEKET